MCALTLCRDVALLASSKDANDVVRAVMGEVVAIAQKLGHTEVSEAAADHQLQRARARIGTAGIQLSMLTDVLAGRRAEVDAIIGNSVRIAKSHGVQVPRLEMLYVLMKGLDAAIAGRSEGQALSGLANENKS